MGYYRLGFKVDTFEKGQLLIRCRSV